MRFRAALIPFPTPDRAASDQECCDQDGCSRSGAIGAETGPSRMALREPIGRAPGNAAENGKPNLRDAWTEQNEWTEHQFRNFGQGGWNFHVGNTPVDLKSFMKSILYSVKRQGLRT